MNTNDDKIIIFTDTDTLSECDIEELNDDTLRELNKENNTNGSK